MKSKFWTRPHRLRKSSFWIRYFSFDHLEVFDINIRLKYTSCHFHITTNPNCLFINWNSFSSRRFSTNWAHCIFSHKNNHLLRINFTIAVVQRLLFYPKFCNAENNHFLFFIFEILGRSRLSWPRCWGRRPRRVVVESDFHSFRNGGRSFEDYSQGLKSFDFLKLLFIYFKKIAF